MENDDLAAIYLYVQTQPTIPNKANQHPEPVQNASFCIGGGIEPRRRQGDCLQFLEGAFPSFQKLIV
jgi:hypothetical protein